MDWAKTRWETFTFWDLVQLMIEVWQYGYMWWVVFNSLWRCDTIWHHGSLSALVEVMAWCLMAPSHYLSHSWLVLSLELSIFQYFVQNSKIFIQGNTFENAICKMAAMPECVDPCGIETAGIFWKKQGQYHGFWCSGPSCHQVINNHGDDCAV